MRLTWNEINDGPWASVFQGRVLDTPDRWKTFLPADITEFGEVMLANPSMIDAISSDAQSALQSFKEVGGASADAVKVAANMALNWFLANKTVQSVVDGTRQLYGVAAQGVGIAASTLRLLQGAYTEPIDVAIQILDIANKIISSNLFQRVIDGLSNIPIVGWIIEGVVDISYYIVQAINIVRNHRGREARRKLVELGSVRAGATSYSGVADEILSRTIMQRLGPSPQSSTFAPDTIFYPPYDGFTATFRRVTVDPDDAAAVGYILTPGDPTGSMGFIMGSGIFTGSFYGGVERPGWVDLAEQYGVSTGIASSWWTMISRELEPACMTVNADDCRSAWVTYLSRLWQLLESVANSGVRFSEWDPEENKFLCTSARKGIGECRTGKINQFVITPPGTSAYQAVDLARLISRQFFNKDRPRDVPTNGKPYDEWSSWPFLPGDVPPNWVIPPPHAVEFDKAPVAQNLSWLRQSQEALLQTEKLFYVTPEDLKTFPAFKDNALKSMWQDNATAFINSDLWKLAHYDEMPEGSLKQAYAEKAAKLGKNPSDINPVCPPGKICPMPTNLAASLPKPSIPKPPAPSYPKKQLVPTILGSRGRSSGIGAAALLAAAGLALAASRR